MVPEISVGAERPDAQVAMQFMRALDPNASAFNMRSFAEAPGLNATPRSHNGVTLDQVSSLLDLSAREGRGLFVVVNEGGQTDASIVCVRALFCDFDAKDYLPEGVAWETATNAQRKVAMGACNKVAKLAHQGAESKDDSPNGYPVGSVFLKSGGGFHVYWFVDGMPVDHFKSLQQALAKRFGSDPAVCNPSRIMRLPGSLHWKSGAGVELEVLLCKPERRYTVDALVKGLGLEVAEPTAQTTTGKCSSTAAPDIDPVLAFLRAHPEHLKPNGRTDPTRPVDVVCPNEAQHSQPDALTSTVYMAHGYNRQARAFHCSHGHCTGLTLKGFLSHIRYGLEIDCPSFNSDDGLACRFVTWLDGHAMYSRGTWHVWTGAYWKPDKLQMEAQLKRYAKELAKETAQEFALKAAAGDGDAKQRMKTVASLLNVDRQARVLKAAETMLRIEAEKLDTHHALLCVPNGAVDLSTGALLPPNPEYRFTLCAGVAYDANAESPRFDQFIREVFPDPEEAAYVQRWTGYALTGHMREEVMAVWYGTGANGKSVLMDALARIFGEYAIAAEPSLLVGKAHAAGAASPDVARLVGRRLCYVNESKVGDKLNDGQVKRLISTEKMTARGLYRDPFDFYPTAKVVLRTNNKPVVDDASEGIWRRLNLLPFAQQFSGPKRDAKLADKLKAELPGVLAWCVRGAVEWFAKGLAPPSSVQAATEAYRADSDDVADWFIVRVEEGGFTTTTALLADYAHHVGLKFPPTAKRFNAMLKERGFKASRTSAGKGFVLTLRPMDGCEFA